VDVLLEKVVHASGRKGVSAPSAVRDERRRGKGALGELAKVALGDLANDLPPTAKLVECLAQGEAPGRERKRLFAAHAFPNRSI